MWGVIGNHGRGGATAFIIQGLDHSRVSVLCGIWHGWRTCSDWGWEKAEMGGRSGGAGCSDGEDFEEVLGWEYCRNGN